MYVVVVVFGNFGNVFEIVVVFVCELVVGVIYYYVVYC